MLCVFQFSRPRRGVEGGLKSTHKMDMYICERMLNFNFKKKKKERLIIFSITWGSTKALNFLSFTVNSTSGSSPHSALKLSSHFASSSSWWRYASPSLKFIISCGWKYLKPTTTPRAPFTSPLLKSTFFNRTTCAPIFNSRVLTACVCALCSY
jgi:hypothetical protein